MRRARQTLHVWLMTAVLDAPMAAQAEGVISAAFGDPTLRYGHAILGDNIEYGSLQLVIREGTDDSTQATRIVLPQDHVFEDLAPRLVDIDQDGAAEVMVVETDVNTGAQLAIYAATGEKIAETPHIGRRNRWLAPIGAADLDGDGSVEVAFVDRPHLAKVLRIWRFRDGHFTEIAQSPGLTNHKIGQDFITSGLRHCDDSVEIITADANWTRIIATRLTSNGLESRDIGSFSSDPKLTKALACH